MANRYFTGFSTVGTDKSKQRTYYDLDLIKRDLMNHFYCRPGERAMRSDWGCSIWNYLMEPLTAGIRGKISDEVERIIRADTRVEIINLNIIEIGQGVRVEVELDFKPLAVVDTMILNFERREAARWDGGF